jgi:hypothetical protein
MSVKRLPLSELELWKRKAKALDRIRAEAELFPDGQIAAPLILAVCAEAENPSA